MLLSAFCLVLVTAGCSDDDGGDKEIDDKTSPGAVNSDDPTEQKNTVAKVEKCEAEVSTTGAYEAEWTGEATVRTGGRNPDEAGPAAVYTLTYKDNRVGLYSAGRDFKGFIAVSVGQASYSSDPADAESLDIDKRGRHADVDVEVTTVGGDAIQLDAEFTCGSDKKD